MNSDKNKHALVRFVVKPIKAYLLVYFIGPPGTYSIYCRAASLLFGQMLANCCCRGTDRANETRWALL